MKPLKFRAITIKSLQEALSGSHAVYPAKGWLMAVREGLGLSRAAVAKRLSISPSAIQSFEKSEERGTISIQNLRRLADALDCEVLLKLAPKDGRSFVDLASLHDPDIANLRAMEHSMNLEAQGSGDLEERKHEHFKS